MAETPQPVNGPHGRPLASVPKQVVYSEADRRRLMAKWDRCFPQYRGLLGAKAS